MKKLICLLTVLILLLSGCGDGPIVPFGAAKEPNPDIVPHCQLRYFTQQMGEESYLNMCAYYESAINFETKCRLPYPVSEQEVETLISVIRYECPELMMLDVSRPFTLYTVNHLVTEVEIPYSMTQQEYETKLEQLRSVIDDLVEQCRDLSEAEKEKLVYDHIVSNSVYDEYAQWAGTAYGCLVEGRAKCDGFSLAMKWIMEETGIACMIIAGDPPDGGVGHAWNVIQIDGQWYDLDVTADVSRDQEKAVSYPAYNVSRDWVRQLYQVKVSYTTPEQLPGAQDMSQSYHGLTGCYVPTGADDRLEELYMQAYSQEGSFVIQFESREDFKAFEEAITDRLDKLGRSERLSSWSWSVYSIPDYRTIRITAGK